MKNITIYIITLAAILLFNSCDDFLDKPILGSQTLDTYFHNEDECDAYVTGTYGFIGNNSWTPVFFWWVINEMSTDDGWMGSTYQPGAYVTMQPVMAYLGNSETTTNKYLNEFWEQRYRGITEVNIGLERIGQADISEDKKNQYLSELKCMRAFFYFELVRNFGGVPLVTKNLGVSEYLQVARSSAVECYAQVEEDLKFAAEHLPYAHEATYASGRMNKGVAQALLTKVYLYQDKYSEAYAMAQNVINNGGYELEADFNNVWSTSGSNKEGIFVIQSSDDQAFKLGNPLSVVTGSRNDAGWAWGAPTSHLENAFIAAGDNVRKKATIIKSGETIQGDPDVGVYNMNANWHKSNRIVRKFYIPKAQRSVPYKWFYTKLDYHVIRLADVLLMAAEAAYEMTPSNEGMARNYLNQVRQRVGLEDVTASGTALQTAIRNERRLELAWENSRLFDLRRWKAADGKSMISHVMGPQGDFVLYNTVHSTDVFETTNQIEPSDEGISFKEGRDELFPLPHSEVLKSNGVIEQNPGF